MTVSKEDALKTLQGDPKTLTDGIEAERQFDELESKRIFAQIMAVSKQDIVKMRKHWSWALLCTIVGIVVFDFILIFFLGFGLISFDGKYSAPIFIVESLVKIFGLAYIVVKFLFNKESLN